MPPPEKKSEIGSQLTMRQVHTGTYVSLLAPKKNDYTAGHPEKTTAYILNVVHSAGVFSLHHPITGKKGIYPRLIMYIPF